ncbi:probable LRR receptor-like serine/threonine-protein kinase At1g05700 [Pistacia vera]|uniref:probable LRR receptor-like serine/threonine-protein kinase At1g05700 n=1 Tax=Pistacia vera TaxID=55513 RepID=UPI00126387E6|nr:probable LRR receptor-like serine/threonine-protein kinase At1g05700 [Pistacia vera]
MKSAGTPRNASDPLQLSFTPEDSNSTIYVYMHFAELEVLPANQSRRFNSSLNRDLNGNFSSDPVSPSYLYMTTFYNPSDFIGGQCDILITRTEDSTLPPIINGVKFYLVKDFAQSETNQVDADAIKNIKSLSKIKDWQGDPCAPQEYLWDGLDCSFNGSSPPRIISLSLSSNGLTGEIPPYISNLTMIQHLDLSNNNLTGSVPEFLSQLPFLKTLNLSGNIAHSVEGNPNLCASVSCGKKRKKKKLLVPVVASFASLFTLLAALALFWRLKSPKQAKESGGTSKKSYGSMAKSRRFTYAELCMITNNFKKELGESRWKDQVSLSFTMSIQYSLPSKRKSPYEKVNHNSKSSKKISILSSQMPTLVDDSDQLQFSVDEGFRTFCSTIQLLFKVVSRRNIRKDIMEIYEVEKEKTMKLLNKNLGRIAITSNL